MERWGSVVEVATVFAACSRPEEDAIIDQILRSKECRGVYTPTASQHPRNMTAARDRAKGKKNWSRSVGGVTISVIHPLLSRWHSNWPSGPFATRHCFSSAALASHQGASRSFEVRLLPG